MRNTNLNITIAGDSDMGDSRYFVVYIRYHYELNNIFCIIVKFYYKTVHI